jgi:hypothetical protein
MSAGRARPGLPPRGQGWAESADPRGRLRASEPVSLLGSFAFVGAARLLSVGQRESVE